MADTTIVNTPGQSTSDASAGWFVSIIVLVAVLVLGFFVYRSGALRRVTPAPAAPSTDINVTLPTASPGAGSGAANQ